MNENVNLSEILKGHEGETFYSPVFGDIKLLKVSLEVLCFDTCDNMYDINDEDRHAILHVYPDGKVYKQSDELCVFPSKDQRDWNKWFEEQKPKVPKTWSEFVKTNKLIYVGTPIEKSAIALIKIHQLIEVGYGGNVTYERCASVEYPSVFKITPTGLNGTLTLTVKEVEVESNQNHIMFHEFEQAEEFLEYPENIQLLMDYFMIND